VTKVDVFVDSIDALKKVLVQNPTDAQKTQISNQIALFIIEAGNIVKSQPGLENIDTDSDIIGDPKFATFLSLLEQLKNDTTFLRLNPEKSFDYYSNISEAFANFVVLTAQTSKGVLAKKAALSGKLLIHFTYLFPKLGIISSNNFCFTIK
jgi:hypothetical protein